MQVKLCFLAVILIYWLIKKYLLNSNENVQRGGKSDQQKDQRKDQQYQSQNYWEYFKMSLDLGG